MTCPKCQGLVIDDSGGERCLNCGWFPGCPVRVVNEAGDELSNVCSKCHDRPKALARSLCQRCLDRARVWQQGRRRRSRGTATHSARHAKAGAP
jgi:hypothetical protein